MLTLSDVSTRSGAAARPSINRNQHEVRWARLRLFATGSLLVLSVGLLALFVSRFAAGRPASDGRWALAVWGMSAGTIYFVGLWPLRRHTFGARHVAWVWCVGLAMRALVFPTTPFLEDDFHRYLWDGAVVAHGGNPYELAPGAVAPIYGGTAQAALPADLLGAEAESVRLKINHPQLTTVYGPVAQAAFALAHAISPWSVLAWRGVLLLFDGLTMVALLALLRMMKKPAGWAAWYWWNPLLLREVISSGHMDLIAAPLVIASLLLAVRGWAISAGSVLALATGAKIWPVVLLPFLLRTTCFRARTTLLTFGAFAAVSALLWMPALTAARSDSNGFHEYSLRWYNNDAVFRATTRLAEVVLPLIRVDATHGPRVARFVVAGALLLFVAAQTKRLNSDINDLVRRSLLVVAVMFFLSPTQFPWYYLWMLPLLAAAPHASLLAYTAFLPLYYAHYEHPWVVCIEHLPILAWFVWESWASRSRAPVTTAVEREAMDA